MTALRQITVETKDGKKAWTEDQVLKVRLLALPTHGNAEHCGSSGGPIPRRTGPRRGGEGNGGDGTKGRRGARGVLGRGVHSRSARAMRPGRYESLASASQGATEANRAKFGTQATTNTEDVKDHTMLDVLNEARRAPAPCPFLTISWSAMVLLAGASPRQYDSRHACTDNVCLPGCRRPFWRTRVCVSTKTGSTREHALPEVSLAQKARLLTLV